MATVNDGSGRRADPGVGASFPPDRGRGGPTVLVVDDHAGFRAEARALLELDGLDVVGGAGTAAEALTLARLLLPNVVLLDIGLPDGDGLELVPQAAKRVSRGGHRADLGATRSGLRRTRRGLGCRRVRREVGAPARRHPDAARTARPIVSRNAAIAVGVIAVLAGLVSEYVRQVWIQPLWVPLVDLAIGQLLVWCGLIAAVARPHQPAGPRLVLAGFLWIIAAPRQWFSGQGMTDDFLQLDVASFTLVGWSDAVLAFIALSFADRWPTRRRDRATTVALVVAFAFQTTVRVLANTDVFFGIQPSDLAWNLQGVADLGRIAALAVAGVLIAQRWLAASALARHLLGPVLLAGAVVGFAPLYGAWYPFSQWGLIDPLPEAVAVPAFWVANALRALVPIAMLVGILRQRSSRAAVAGAIATVGPATSPTDLEAALSRRSGRSLAARARVG